MIKDYGYFSKVWGDDCLILEMTKSLHLGMLMGLTGKAKFRKKSYLGTTHSLSTSVYSPTQGDKEYEQHLWPFRDHWLKWTPDPLPFSSDFPWRPLHLLLWHLPDSRQPALPGLWASRDSHVEGRAGSAGAEGTVHKGHWINPIFGAS